MKKQYSVYIITNQNDSVLYIGVTSNLMRRLYQHHKKVLEGFSKQYNLSKLVYFEIFDNPTDAIAREKQLKRWHREWKDNLISDFNPGWQDLKDKVKE